MLVANSKRVALPVSRNVIFALAVGVLVNDMALRGVITHGEENNWINSMDNNFHFSVLTLSENIPNTGNPPLHIVQIGAVDRDKDVKFFDFRKMGGRHNESVINRP